jgi:hypothetical protein
MFRSTTGGERLRTEELFLAIGFDLSPKLHPPMSRVLGSFEP